MATSTTFVLANEKAGRRSGQIRLHGPEDFAAMRKAGALTAEALDLIGPLVKPGVTTASLDQFLFEFAGKATTTPTRRPLTYRGYRRSVCISINHVVCHGVPDEKPLRDGDILNIDVTLIVDGWHGDASRMFVAGRGPTAGAAPDRRNLRGDDARHRSHQAWRDDGRHWLRYSDLRRGRALFGRARLLCGHGLGKLFHDEPNILHVGRKGGKAFRFAPAHVLRRSSRRSISAGYGVKILADGWTQAVTRDRSLVGPIRAYGRRDGDRLRDFHPLAHRSRSRAN